LKGERLGEGVSVQQYTLTPARPKAGEPDFGAQASASREREFRMDAKYMKKGH